MKRENGDIISKIDEMCYSFNIYRGFLIDKTYCCNLGLIGNGNT